MPPQSPRVQIVRRENLQSRRDLLRRELDRLVEQLRWMPQVRKIIAFGSSLSGHIHEASDIDLIVVMQTDERFIDRIQNLTAKLDPKVATDLLVYTPEEFEDLLGWSDFVQTAVETGRVLYEADKRA